MEEAEISALLSEDTIGLKILLGYLPQFRNAHPQAHPTFRTLLNDAKACQAMLTDSVIPISIEWDPVIEYEYEYGRNIKWGVRMRLQNNSSKHVHSGRGYYTFQFPNSEKVIKQGMFLTKDLPPNSTSTHTLQFFSAQLMDQLLEIKPKELTLGLVFSEMTVDQGLLLLRFQDF